MADAPPSTASQERAEITVHWLERSRSQRLVWLLEECQIPYNIKAYKRSKGLAPPEMREVHPLGKSPILTIRVPEQTEQLVLAESGAICEYIADHFAPHLIPKRYKSGQEGKICAETESWLRYRYYMHYCEGSFMSLLMREHTLHGLKGPEVSSKNLTLENLAKTHLTFLESQISSTPDGGPYLCGRDLTAADIMMVFPLLVVKSTGGLAEYPELDTYVQHLIGRPAYKEAIKKSEAASGEEYQVV